MSENSSRTQVSSGGIGCFTLLGLIFVTLKLIGEITWSWWWVLAPFWAPTAIFMVFVVMMLSLAGVAELTSRK